MVEEELEKQNTIKNQEKLEKQNTIKIELELELEIENKNRIKRVYKLLYTFLGKLPDIFIYNLCIPITI
jgi:hypothetical protein